MTLDVTMENVYVPNGNVMDLVIVQMARMKKIAHILAVNLINGNVIPTHGTVSHVLPNIKDVITSLIVQMDQMKRIVLLQLWTAVPKMYLCVLMGDNVLMCRRNVMENMIVEI